MIPIVQKEKVMKTLIVATLMLLTAESFARDSSGTYTVLGVGSISCGTVLEEYRRDTLLYKSMETWITGYFTAINYHVYDGKNIQHGTDINSVMLWIRNYRQANPLKDLEKATKSLYIELRDK